MEQVQRDEKPGHRRFQQPGTAQDAAAVETVGAVAGGENQQRHRRELREPDVAEREGAARDRIDLPADHHGEDLGRDGPRKPRPEQGAHTRMAQDGEAGGRHGDNAERIRQSYG